MDGEEKRKTNERLLEKAGPKHDSLNTISKTEHKLSYFGNVIWKSLPRLEKDIIENTIPRQRRKEQPQTSWIENIKVWTGSVMMLRTSYHAIDREVWRKLIHDVTDSPMRMAKTRHNKTRGINANLI